MRLFLTILFTIITLNFFVISLNEEEFPDLRHNYILATVFMSALLFLLYKL